MAGAQPNIVEEANSEFPSPAPDPSKIGTLRIFQLQNADINYLGRKLGLDGWLVSKGEAVQVLYTTLDGQATIVGTLYGPTGDLLTPFQVKAAKERHPLNLTHTVDTGTADPTNPASLIQSQPVATPSSVDPVTASPASDRLWTEISETPTIGFGPTGTPALYVFMDPQCHYCHDLYVSLRDQFLPAGKFQLRVIPVAILGSESVDEAKRILSADDPAKAWDAVENGSTGTLPTTIKPEANTTLDANHRIMGEWKLAGTPAAVYRGKDGRVKLIYGAPPNVQQMVEDISK